MSILFIILIAAGAFFIVGHPLFREGSGDELLGDSSAMADARDLTSKKGEVYVAIKDMDFDYMTGKLSKEDYEELRNKYRLKALHIMKEMDEKKGTGAKETEEDLEEEILSLRRGNKTKEGERICSSCGSPIHSDDKFCASCGSQASFSLSCRKCKERIGEGDKFCSFCGEKIA